jgi:hypothetical protein
MTWGRQSFATIAWAQVKPIRPGSDGGVDFELQVRREGPVLLAADRPLVLVSSFSEGQP